MKFSVLMSVYSKEKPEYFEQAIKSVLAQTLVPNEIVIVKDGPLTKELDNVINSYLKNYNELFKIVELDENYGLGIALNRGLEKCSNELVARMDTDDICEHDRFEKQINEFRKNNKLSLVGGIIAEFNNIVGDKNQLRYVPEKNNQIYQKLKKRNVFNHVTVMFKKSDVLNAGGYMNCPSFEDYYLWVRMAINKCEFYNIQSVLVNVRVGNDMLRRRGGINYFKYCKEFYKKLLASGFIKQIEYYQSLVVRFIVAIAPLSIRNYIYSSLLRRKKKV